MYVYRYGYNNIKIFSTTNTQVCQIMRVYSECQHGAPPLAAVETIDLYNGIIDII